MINLCPALVMSDVLWGAIKVKIGIGSWFDDRPGILICCLDYKYSSFSQEKIKATVHWTLYCVLYKNGE